MSDDLIGNFDGGSAPESTSTTTSDDDLVSNLVGEGKKFKDLSALARAKVEADSFIETLKQENAEYRNKLAELEKASVRSTTIDEILERLDKKAPPSEEGNQPLLSKEDISKLVEDTIKQRDSAQTKVQNREAVNKAVLEAFNGDDTAAREHLRARAAQLGMSPEDVRQIAEGKPQVFLELFKPQSNNRGSAPAIGSVPNSSPPQDGERTQSYYTNLRREMGTTKFWNDSKLVRQMEQDAARLGSKFYN